MQEQTTGKTYSEAVENERLRFALAAAGIGTWDLDPVNNVVVWDERCRELYGFAPGETIPYEDVLRYIHPDDVPLVDAAVREALNPATTGTYEVRYRTIGVDKRERWILSKGKAYFNADGIATRFAGTAQDITQALEEQERMAASEQIARVALENSNSGYFRYNTETGELDYSPGYARIFTGVDGGQLTREEVLRHLHPDDRPLRDKALLQAAETGQLEYEVRTIWTDGSIHWVRAKGTTINGAGGNSNFITGTVYDTTAEHQQHEALKEAEALLENAFNGSAIGMAFTSLEGLLLSVNDAYAGILGYTRQELNGKTFRELTHPEDIDKNDQLYKEMAAGTRNYFTIEKRYLHKDGSIRRVHKNVTLVPGTGGAESRALAVARDITYERESEEELVATQAMFRNVANSSPTGLWLSDREGGLTYLNKTLVIWSGRRYEDLLGAGWASSIYEADRERTGEVYRTAIAARAHYDILFRIYKSDGSIAWCRTAGDPYYDENGEYAGYAGYCMDINELIEGQEALLASEARFRLLIEEAPVATCLFVGRDMKIEIANDIVIGFWGKDASVIGQPLAQAVPELEGQPFLQILDDVYTSGTTYEAAGMPAQLPLNGVMTTYYFDFTYKPLRNADGEVYAIMEMAVDVTAKVIASKALEDAKKTLELAIEVAELGIYSLDVVNNTASYSARFMDWYGLGDMQATTQELNARTHPDDAAMVTESIQKAIAAGGERRYDLVYRIIHPDSHEIRYVRSIGQVQMDGERPVTVAGILQDVTEDATARLALEESELFTRSIIDNSPVAKIVFVGEEMKVNIINQNMLAMLGRDASIIGMPFDEAVPELKDTPMMDRLQAVYVTGETFYQPEERLDLVKHGVPYTGYYNYIYKALYNTADDIYGIIVTAVEITEQVLARQQIEVAEEALRGAVELAELGTWSIDLPATTLDYSERLREWMGFAPDMVITIEDAYSVIAAEDREAVRESILAAIAPNSQHVYDVTYTIFNKMTGRERIVHAQGKALFHENGEAYRITGTAQDITAQKKIQLELEQQVQERTEELQAVNEELITTNEELAESNTQLIHSNEELAQYAYVASHDLQEPLRKIRIFSDILNKKATLPGDSQELVGKISQSAERMSLLIRDLLEFSRLLKSDLLLQPVDLTAVANMVITDFELTITEKQARVRIGRLPAIQAVALQMNQLFYNLINNALKFSHAGTPPEIDINAEPISREEAATYVGRTLPFAQYYRIAFQDNGIGFEAQYAEQIFEVFKRLHGRDAYPGSGIGLALCRRIVANHQGNLSAVSAPGAGATFYIVLPDRQVDGDIG